MQIRTRNKYIFLFCDFGAPQTYLQAIVVIAFLGTNLFDKTFQLFQPLFHGAHVGVTAAEKAAKTQVLFVASLSQNHQTLKYREHRQKSMNIVQALFDRVHIDGRQQIDEIADFVHAKHLRWLANETIKGGPHQRHGHIVGEPIQIAYLFHQKHQIVVVVQLVKESFGYYVNLMGMTIIKR